MKGKRKNKSENMLGASQKSLSGFFGDQEKEEKIVENENVKKEDSKQIFIRKSNQIETDYYEKSCVETCAKIIRERFNVNIEILPVMYGKNPKIYGYYMIIMIKSGNRERIEELITNECHLKIYWNRK